MMAESRILLPSGSGAGSGMDQPVLGSWGRCKMNMAVRSRTAGDDLGIVEDGEESFQGAVAETVEVVAAGEDEFGAGAMEGGGEGLRGLHPAIDGDAMDAVGFSGIGKGRAGGQGVDDALLDAGEGRGIGRVFHFDDESSMGGCAGAGISGAVCFVFRGMRGNVDL